MSTKKTFTLQYRREQRVTRVIVAETEAEAGILFERMIGNMQLSSEDDESDDPGEVEVIQIDQGPS